MAEPPNYDRYTDPARRALALADDEADRLGPGYGYVTTGHLLLGLLRATDDGVSAQILQRLGVSIDTDAARQAFQDILLYQARPAAG